MSMSPRLLRPRDTAFSPRSIPGLALWLDASSSESLYTTDAGPVVAVTQPTDIAGCLCWYDASDADSITASGGLVSQWNDKSGNARHATASGALRPTSGGSQNGRTVMQFTGTQAMTITGNFLQSDNVTMFAVAMKNTDHYGGIITSAPSNPEDSPVLCFYLTTIAWLNRRVLVQQATGNGVYRIVSGQSSGTSQFGWFDGVRGADTGTATPTNTAGTITKIGALRTSSTADLNGNIAEIVCYSGNLTTAQRASVEAYLATKWGISGVHAPATASSDPVGYWADKSGNGRHLTQATANLRGLVFTSSGRTRVDIPATLNSGFSSASPTTSSSGTVIQAGRFAGNPSWLTILRGDGSAFVDAASSGSGAAPYDGAGTPSFFVQGAPVAATRGTLYSGLNDKNAVFSATNINFSTWSSGWRYYNFGSSFQFIGEMGEVLVYNRALTTAERQRAERYLAARWGITLAPQVSNADAQDWINRVYQNGGTVSSATAASVNQFCVDIENAPGGSIRDRFLRLNLFAGSFQGAFVPLFRGPSLGGTQYGGATDTNVGPFVSGDYLETGAGGGLKGNGSSKYLNTGLAPNALPSLATGHMAVYRGAGTAANQTMIAVRSDTDYYELLKRGDSRHHAAWGQTSLAVQSGSEPSHEDAGLRVASRTSATLLRLYQNATGIADQTASVTPASTSREWFVFAMNQGTLANYWGNATSSLSIPLKSYSIGSGLSDADVVAYTNAINAFQTALSRA